MHRNYSNELNFNLSFPLSIRAYAYEDDYNELVKQTKEILEKEGVANNVSENNALFDECVLVGLDVYISYPDKYYTSGVIDICQNIRAALCECAVLQNVDQIKIHDTRICDTTIDGFLFVRIYALDAFDIDELGFAAQTIEKEGAL